MADKSNWWLVGLGIAGLAIELGSHALAAGARDEQIRNVVTLQAEDHQKLEQFQTAKQADDLKHAQVLQSINDRLGYLEANQRKCGR